jgi:KDO2-lipid IV(A) lauroyltransferase
MTENPIPPEPADRPALSPQGAVVSLIVALLLKLGPVRASNLMGALFRAIGPLLPVTRVAHANLAAAFPEKDATWRRAVVKDMWESLGRTAGEMPHLATLPKNSPSGPGWEMQNEHLVQAQARKGGPAIFVSGHIGNWEMMPPALATYGMPVSSVYRPTADRSVDNLILRLRRQAIGAPVPMFTKGAAGARDALAHLRRGGFLGMLIDQKMNDGIPARLFGLPAMTAPAAAALALRFRCPIFPGHVERIGPARLRLVADDPPPLPDTGDKQADIAALTQTLNDRLEKWIREQPHAWLWLHRRFPTSVVPTRNTKHH